MIAAPMRRTVGGSRGAAPAVPRMPSVPNSRAAISAEPDVELGGLEADNGHVGRLNEAHGKIVPSAHEAREVSVHLQVLGTNRGDGRRGALHAHRNLSGAGRGVNSRSGRTE